MKKLDIRELQAELKQAEFDIARKARTIIALNESYKALRDGLEPKLADITGKRNAAESRAEEAERSAEAMSEKVRSLAPHGTCACSYDKPGDLCMHHSPQLVKAEARAEQWERKFNDDGPRCKVRTDSKEGRFIAPTDCGKEDLEQRLARMKEIVAIGVNALEHCDRRHKKCNCSKEALAEIAAALRELESK
jgi:chromosome segregation ATPase